MIRLFLACLLTLAIATPVAAADTGLPLPATLRLVHVSKDIWRADYRLSEPVDRIDLDPNVGAYRTQAWRILTPGVHLEKDASHETLIADGKPLTAFSVEISLYLPFAQGNYTPFDRFSDGGTDIYLGFLTGDAHQGSKTRPLHLDIQLKGLADEIVIPPDSRDPTNPDYAYFGPSRPAAFGAATIVLDPATPAWLVPVIEDTTAKITAYYDRGFERKLRGKPLLLLSIGSLSTQGLSIKGGTFDNKIVYRFEGVALLHDKPAVRRHVSELIAHELAHIWQRNVARGGVGDQEAWVHEGGAEAIAVDALRATGLFSPEEADTYSANLLKECDQLKGSVESYRGFYACGYKRFRDTHLNVLALWKSMMETSESTGEPYSSRMIQTLVEQTRTTQ